VLQSHGYRYRLGALAPLKIRKANKGRLVFPRFRRSNNPIDECKRWFTVSKVLYEKTCFKTSTRQTTAIALPTNRHNTLH